MGDSLADAFDDSEACRGLLLGKTAFRARAALSAPIPRASCLRSTSPFQPLGDFRFNRYRKRMKELCSFSTKKTAKHRIEPHKDVFKRIISFQKDGLGSTMVKSEPGERKRNASRFRRLDRI
ncbi:hypothetical protein DLM76_20835 [Leptospira yasudae]|nr:hypothetical protein DLM76_20835 [Leptospira yasudae]